MKNCFCFFFLKEHAAHLVSVSTKIKEGGESSRNTKEFFLNHIRVMKLQLEKCKFNIRTTLSIYPSGCKWLPRWRPHCLSAISPLLCIPQVASHSSVLWTQYSQQKCLLPGSSYDVFMLPKLTLHGHYFLINCDEGRFILLSSENPSGTCTPFHT